MATVPTVDEIRKWLKLAEAAMDNDELGEVLAGEVASQAKVCRMPPYIWPGEVQIPDDLRLALYRRCGRAVAARGVPLGLAGSDEFGQARLPAWDAEIERYEGPYRWFVAG